MADEEQPDKPSSSEDMGRARQHGQRRYIVRGLVVVLLLGVSVVSAAYVFIGSHEGGVVDDVVEPPVDRAIRLRDALGLRSDRVFVEGLYAVDAPREVVASELSWPLRVTPEEAVALHDFEEASGAMEVVLNYGEGFATDSYGGFWAEPIPADEEGLRQRFVVAFTQDLNIHESAVTQLFAFPERLRVTQVTATLEELRLLKEEVKLHVDELAEAGITLVGVGIRQTDNAVVVTVEEDSQRVLQFLKERHGSGHILIREGVVQAP